MRTQELVAIYGMGPDGPGLVGTIAKTIAAAGGNIVDLSQGAAHASSPDLRRRSRTGRH